MAAEKNEKVQNEKVVRGTNDNDVKIAEIKASATGTNGNDVKIAAIQFDIEKVRFDLEAERLSGEEAYKKYQSELVDKTKRFEIMTKAIQGTTCAGMVLAGYLFRTKLSADIERFKVEFGDK